MVAWLKKEVYTKRLSSTSFLASWLVLICYLTFTLLAFARYALPYFPMQNWLSDLGSSKLNPDGAIFYNTGIILTGLLLALFFLGLSRLSIAGKRVQNSMVRITQGFGLAGAFSMVMSAVYPIQFFTMHSFWSAALYILLGTAFGFSVSALRYDPKVPRWLLALGILTALSAMLMGIFQTITLIEWVTVPLFLVYTLLLGGQVRKSSTVMDKNRSYSDR